MKYAKEIIEFMAENPNREFRTGVLVNHVSGGKPATSRERNAVRQGVARVLDAMVKSGSLMRRDPISGRGGYATYQLKSEEKCDTGIEEKQTDCATMGRGQLRPEQMQLLAKIRESVRARGLRDPWYSYRAHQKGALERGIGFELDFFEWWDIWKDLYHLRGIGDGKYCMGRFGDVGPYAVGNVYITTNKQNRQDFYSSVKNAEAKRLRAEQKRARLMSLVEHFDQRHGPNPPYELMIETRRTQLRP